MQMNPNSHLSNTQIEFLDELIELVNEGWRIDEQYYSFYKNYIEKWQNQGYYDDAMLYFWYYEPIEGLSSKRVDNFNGFIKVVNGLGFIFPSTQQALIISTLKNIEKLKASFTIENRTKAIASYWQAIDYGEAIDVGSLCKKFNIMRDEHLIVQEDNYEELNKQLFNSVYQDILNVCDLWETRYPRIKIYENLVYNGESLESQANNIDIQYEADMLETLGFDEILIERKHLIHSKAQKLLDWVKHFLQK